LLEYLLLRFFIGGLIVSSFAVLGDIFRPRSFAGLLGGAPSVALASIYLTVHREGSAFATIEACSMIFGAIALIICAYVLSQFVVRYQLKASGMAFVVCGVWSVSAAVLWVVALK
jgi:uncharacterized membrane protein (GlpM family)